MNDDTSSERYFLAAKQFCKVRRAMRRGCGKLWAPTELVERHRMNFWPGLFAVLATNLSACASGAPLETPASKDEVNAASHTFLACLFAAADKSDDQTSDASTIAGAILGQCGQEFRAWEILSIKGKDSDSAEVIMNTYDRGRLGVATNVVLRERQMARHGAHPASN